MARYTKLYHSIWSDADFLKLPTDSKTLYMLLMSQPDISTCGVLPLTPKRWKSLLPDRTLSQVTKAIQPLAAARFVVVDEATEELWVRSYIRHDELFRVPNGRKSITRTFGEVLSQPIRQRIVGVLRTLDVTLAETLGGTLPETVEPLPNTSPTPTPLPETETVVSSSNGSSNALRAVDDDDENTARFEQALAAIIDRRMQQAGNVRDPRAYTARIRANIDTDERRRLATLLAANPELHPAGIADRFDIPTPTERAARAEPERHDCGTCDSTGWIEVHVTGCTGITDPDCACRTGVVDRCPTCNRQEQTA